MSKLLQRLEHPERSIRSKARLSLLGFKGGYHNLAAYQHEKLNAAKWHKAHRARCNVGGDKYLAKIRAKYGSTAQRYRYRYAIENQAKKQAERKALLNEYFNTPLLQPRKLQKHHRSKRPSSGVLRGRQHHPKKQWPLDL